MSCEWRQNGSVLHRGDALRWLAEQPAGCADAVITDPPYGIAWRTRDGRKVLNDERPYIWFLGEAARVLKDGGAMVCFTRWDVQEIWRAAIEAAGLEVTSQLVWDRVIHGKGDVRRQFAPQHDLAWFAAKGEFRFPGRRPHSVLHVMRRSETLHPTEKPVELLLELVTTVAPEGGLVVDPFAGSGSTGVACIVSGRRFAGCELDEGHWRVAARRLGEAAPLYTARERQAELGE